MPPRPKNKFIAKVALPDFDYEVSSLPDKELTPIKVVEKLEEFCAFVRQVLKQVTPPLT